MACRYMALTFHKVALELKLCIIAPERPGIGKQHSRTAADVQCVSLRPADLCYLGNGYENSHHVPVLRWWFLIGSQPTNNIIQ